MHEARTAIITGAASGLGRAIAVALAERGWRLALADVDVEGAEETGALVRAAGGEARVEQLDVSRFEAWQSLVARLQAQWPRLDLLVNNAGVSCAGEVGLVTMDDWRWIVDTNLFGVIHGCHACVEWLKQNPSGARIVNVSSVAAFASAPMMAAYNVSKAGVLALSETLYAELRPHGVGVTVVCPGFFSTNLLTSGRFLTDEQREAAAWYMQRANISASDVAAATLRGMDRGQLYVVVPWRARLAWRLKRLWPRGLLKLLSANYGRQLRRSAAVREQPQAAAAACGGPSDTPSCSA